MRYVALYITTTFLVQHFLPKELTNLSMKLITNSFI